jgi:ADP-ribosylglycohydrolase
MYSSRREKTISSALWSAYGDILGFPTELVNESGVLRRLGEPRITRPKSWKRLIGGRAGTWVELGAGAYSDDTQLRLATSRAIRADGYFDVEAFAKIELPVWLSYALGAGRGSKVAAASLAQRSANWFTNFFEQKEIVYTSGGGNGAAMRIQPHVWAAQDLGNPASYLPDVLQNSICTHGHPRGIAGSVLHAVCLSHILNYGEIPHPSDWKMLGNFISIATEYVEENADLSTFWLPTWNIRTGRQFAEEMEQARLEWERDVSTAEEILSSTEIRDSYDVLIDRLGGRSPTERGSGLKCALLSLAAAWIYRSSDPAEALVVVANSLGSDTDTIGTMAGALLGALNPKFLPSGEIQDREYIVQEADRMFAISEEATKLSFTYPDLIEWQPPRSQIEAVTVGANSLIVAGLGEAIPRSQQYALARSETSWQWLELSFGQTILCKRRTDLPRTSSNHIVGYAKAPDKNKDLQKEALHSASLNRAGPVVGQRSIWKELELERPEPKVDRQNLRTAMKPSPEPELLDEMTDRVIRSGFSPVEIGRQFLALADLPNGLELSIGYAAVIVKARKARLKRKVEEKLNEPNVG